MTHEYHVYIMTNRYHTVLYTGVTNDIARQCGEHALKVGGSFTRRYNVDRLVYAESYSNIEDAIRRETQIKGYSRAKKVALIMKSNSEWRDLMKDVSPTQTPGPSRRSE